MGFQETFNARVIPAQNRAFGVQATLAQGVIVTNAFDVVWADRDWAIETEEGFVTSYHSRAFEFAMADAVDPGDGVTLITPRPGDRLTVTDSDESEKIYEITPVPGQKAVEFMAGNFRWRVLTKLVL